MSDVNVEIGIDGKSVKPSLDKMRAEFRSWGQQVADDIQNLGGKRAGPSASTFKERFDAEDRLAAFRRQRSLSEADDLGRLKIMQRDLAALVTQRGKVEGDLTERLRIQLQIEQQMLAIRRQRAAMRAPADEAASRASGETAAAATALATQRTRQTWTEASTIERIKIVTGELQTLARQRAATEAGTTQHLRLQAQIEERIAQLRGLRTTAAAERGAAAAQATRDARIVAEAEAARSLPRAISRSLNRSITASMIGARLVPTPDIGTFTRFFETIGAKARAAREEAKELGTTLDATTARAAALGDAFETGRSRFSRMGEYIAAEWDAATTILAKFASTAYGVLRDGDISPSNISRAWQSYGTQEQAAARIAENEQTLKRKRRESLDEQKRLTREIADLEKRAAELAEESRFNALTATEKVADLENRILQNMEKQAALRQQIEGFGTEKEKTQLRQQLAAAQVENEQLLQRLATASKQASDESAESAIKQAREDEAARQKRAAEEESLAREIADKRARYESLAQERELAAMTPQQRRDHYANMVTYLGGQATRAAAGGDAVGAYESLAAQEEALKNLRALTSNITPAITDLESYGGGFAGVSDTIPTNPEQERQTKLLEDQLATQRETLSAIQSIRVTSSDNEATFGTSY